jgi:hypothetical protein
MNRFAQHMSNVAVERLGPRSESPIDQEARLEGPPDDEWGHSDSVDPDNVGDIADEGTGHRG